MIINKKKLLISINIAHGMGKYLFIIISVFLAFSAVRAEAKQLLTQSDFTYIGAFLMPASTGSGDAPFGRGLAHRYVNGELRMFSTSWNPQDVYEVKVPTLSVNGPFQTAQVARNWGDIYHGQRVTNSGASEVFGLYWDNADQRLYWTYGDVYNTNGGNDPSIGYSTLNDSTGGSTAFGPWSFQGRGPKADMGCVVPIPDWFGSAYLAGKRLGVGCGGYFSILTTGPVSMGPALTAINPPGQSGGSVSYTNLVGYPAGSGYPSQAADWGHRDTNYIGTGNWVAPSPQNGIGYWTAGDYLWQAAAWIDLPDKSGLIYFPSISKGHIFYQTSTLNADGANHWWYEYDPADLARVAQGLSQSAIQPAAEWQVNYPGLSYPLPAWSDLPPNKVTGVTYDSTTKRLYIAVEMAGAGGAYGVHKVYVYQVQSGASSDTTPPSAPTGLRRR